MEPASIPQILTIDDDPVITRLVRLSLERTKRYVVHVENRSVAAKGRALEIRPQLILLDLNMPGMDGSSLADEIRTDPILRATPILIITGWLTASEAVRHTQDTPRTEVLSKPFDARTLVERVDRILMA